MKKLFFVRHGLSEFNKQGLFAGSTDTPLHDEGRQQAKAAGEKLKNMRIDYIVASPLSRARETAEIIAREIGYPIDKIHINDLFVERHYGEQEGKAWAPDLDLDGIADIESVDNLLSRSKLALEFLANIANESAIIAARNNRKEIIQDDVTSAFEKVAIGPERKSKIMNEKEKELTAYHEAGHAIVGHVLPDSDMVHKVTIIPRGGTGGVTWFIPPEDKSYHSIIEYKDVLARMLGGRIAEEVIYGLDRVTTGAGSDLQKAAELAREMVINQGMGKKLRDQVFHVEEGLMMERMVHERQYSDETAKIIDDEVESLITEAATRAREVIKANRDRLEKLKDRLLEKETVEAEEVIEILEGAALPKVATLY